MTEQFLMTIPLIILVTVMLLAFAGCGELIPLDDHQAAANYQDAITPESSLEGYWRLGEASGTVANDVKGPHAHDGEYQGNVTLGVKPGLIDCDTDTAVSFDGSSGQVKVPPPQDPAAANPLNPPKFSIEAWVKLQEVPGTARAIVSSFDEPAHAGYAILAGSRSSWEAWVGDGTVWQKLNSEISIRQDQVTYLLLAFDGSTLRLGVDGNLAEAKTLAVSNFKPNQTQPLLIGGPGPEGAKHFQGVIDEVAVYHDALDQNRAAAHFVANGEGCGPGAPIALTGNASAIAATQATLNGTVNPNGKPTNYHFEYGETDTYGSATPDASAGSGTADQPESATISGLAPSTAYHHRLVAQSSAGVGTGSDHTLKTPPSPTYRNTVLGTPGLLAYYRLGETMGVMAFDSVPPPATKNTGNYIGGFTLNQPGALTGDPDAAVLFDGTSGQMTANGPVLSGACSIEGWFYWTGGRGLLSDDVTGGSGWRFVYDVNGSLTYRFAGTSFTTAVTTASVQNAWHHFVATKDAAGNFAFYLDGQQIHTGTGAPPGIGPKPPWHLMRDRPSGQYAAGRADEVAMYDVALDTPTVKQHFELGKSG